MATCSRKPARSHCDLVRAADRLPSGGAWRAGATDSRRAAACKRAISIRGGSIIGRKPSPRPTPGPERLAEFAPLGLAEACAWHRPQASHIGRQVAYNGRSRHRLVSAPAPVDAKSGIPLRREILYWSVGTWHGCATKCKNPSNDRAFARLPDRLI